MSCVTCRGAWKYTGSIPEVYRVEWLSLHSRTQDLHSVLASSCLCSSAWNNSAPTGRIFIKFGF
jgi:hypothetical protein